MTREVQANRHRKARFLPDLGETLHQEASFLDRDLQELAKAAILDRMGRVHHQSMDLAVPVKGRCLGKAHP